MQQDSSRTKSKHMIYSDRLRLIQLSIMIKFRDFGKIGISIMVELFLSG